MTITATPGDIESVRSALEDLNQNGNGVLEVPPGEYINDGEPLEYDDFVRIVGFEGKTIFKLGDNYAHTSCFRQVAQDVHGFSIEGITIDLNGKQNKTGIIAYGVSDFSIKKVRVINAIPGSSGAGIDIDSASHFYIGFCEIDHMSGHAIALKNSHHGKLEYNQGSYSAHRNLLVDPDCYAIDVFNDYYHHATLHGVHNSHGTHDIRYINVESSYNTLSGFANQSDNGQSGSESYNNKYINPIARGNGENAMVNDYAWDVQVIGGEFHNSGQNGIRNKHSSFGRFIGIDIIDNTLRGVVNEGNCTGNIIQSNTISGSGADGVWLFGNSTLNTVTNNTILDSSRLNIKTYYGLKITSNGGAHPTNNLCFPNTYANVSTYKPQKAAIYAPNGEYNGNVLTEQSMRNMEHNQWEGSVT